MIELENNFFDNLQHQIKVKQLEQFKNKLPSLKDQLNECNLAVQELREKFEEIRRRSAYRRIVGQLNEFVKEE